MNPVDELTKRVRLIGSQRALAREFRISEQYLSDLLNGRRVVSDRVLDLLGLERMIRRKKKSQATKEDDEYFRSGTRYPGQ